MPRARRVVGAATVAAALALAGCRGGGHTGARREAPSPSPTAAAALREIEVAAAPGSAAISLATTPNGDFLLSWVEPLERDLSALRLSRRGAGEPWSEPVTVAEGPRWFVNWADVPHVGALADETLFAHWLEKHPGAGHHEYGIRMTRSRDGGRSWDAPFAPYSDLTPGEHGFVSLAPAAEGRMGVLFLDGRNVERPQGAMSLRFASLGPVGAPEPDVLVDDRVCDCCQTAMARTASGLVIAYRDRTDGEVRDIAVVRYEQAGFSEPVFPGDERWEINGCPVNGPAIDAEGQRVALAWYTMAGGTPRVKVAFSADGGGSWGPPVAVNDGQPLGRVGVAVVRAGALVSWLEETPRGVEVRVRRVAADKVAGPSATVAGSSAARASGFPQLEAAGGEVVMAWRDASEPARLRTAIVGLRQ